MAEGYERLPTCLADFHDQVGADYYARTNGRPPPVRPSRVRGTRLSWGQRRPRGVRGHASIEADLAVIGLARGTRPRARAVPRPGRPTVVMTGTDRGVPTGQVGRCGGLTVHLIPKWGGAVLPLVVMGTRPSWRMRASRTSSVTQAAQVVRGVS